MQTAAQVITGDRYMEIMWPLNDMFRSCLHRINVLPYDAAFEVEADEAIDRMQKDIATAWQGLSDGAWRVLLERHTQMIVVALANQRERNPLLTLPPGPPLSDEELRIGLALYFLHRMKLPHPPADRSPSETPSSPDAKGH